MLETWTPEAVIAVIIATALCIGALIIVVAMFNKDLRGKGDF